MKLVELLIRWFEVVGIKRPGDRPLLDLEVTRQNSPPDERYVEDAEEAADNEGTSYESRRGCRSASRSEARVAVMLASLDGRLSTETTFTENISSHGARIVARQHWRVNDTLLVKSLEGNFQSDARVVYSQHLTENSLAIGLVLFYPTGQWLEKMQLPNP